MVKSLKMNRWSNFMFSIFSLESRRLLLELNESPSWRSLKHFFISADPYRPNLKKLLQGAWELERTAPGFAMRGAGSALRIGRIMRTGPTDSSDICRTNGTKDRLQRGQYIRQLELGTWKTSWCFRDASKERLHSWIIYNQCSGSLAFWYGSWSMDSYLRPKDP